MRAMAYLLQRLSQYLRQVLATFAFTFKQLVSHALRGLLTHAGEHAQCLDELFQQGGTHGRGYLNRPRLVVGAIRTATSCRAATACLP